VGLGARDMVSAGRISIISFNINQVIPSSNLNHSGARSEFAQSSHALNAAEQRAASAMTSPDMPGEEQVARRVLVVDDNVDAADSTGELLRILGYEVEVAHGGHAALELLAAARFDAALIDIGMPLMDGYELAARVRNLAGGDAIRLIALTGWGNDEDKSRTGAAGFNDHWVKPIDIEKLKQV
jgi:CheY-like chemotaxis protein